MLDRVESLREVSRSKKHPRARLGFIKPIKNGTKKIKYLILNRPSRAETGLARRENGVRLQKVE